MEVAGRERGRKSNHSRSGCTACGNSSRRILDNYAFTRAAADSTRGKRIAIRCRLPVLHVLGGHENRRHRELRCSHPRQRESSTAGRDEGAPRIRDGCQHGCGTRQRDEIRGVLQLGRFEPRLFSVGVEVRRQRTDRFNRSPTMRSLHNAARIEAVTRRPELPNALHNGS